MHNIISNNWVISIITGIISGFLVNIVSNTIMKKRGREDYFRKVSEANKSVIISLKPYISEKGLPDVDIFKAIIASTARTFSIKDTDMYTVAIYCEELIHEIISDVYVSSDKKKEYTESLIEYKNRLLMQDEQPDYDSNSVINSDNNEYRRKFAVYISILVAMFTMIISLMTLTEEYPFVFSFENEPIIWIPVFLITIIFMVTFTLLFSDRLLKIQKEKIHNRLENEKRVVQYHDSIKNSLKNDEDDSQHNNLAN